MNKSEDNINNIKNNIKTYCNKYDNTKNFEENLINNGFFSGKNKKNENENIENDDNSEDTYPQKIKEIIKIMTIWKIKEKRKLIQRKIKLER